jgi:hypothetical protein
MGAAHEEPRRIAATPGLALAATIVWRVPGSLGAFVAATSSDAPSSSDALGDGAILSIETALAPVAVSLI